MSHSFQLRLDTLEIPVSNLERSKVWYAAVFGVEPSWSDDNHCQLTGTGKQDPGIRFLLVKTGSPERLGFKNSGTGVDHSFADLEVGDIAAFHRALSASGIGVPELKDPDYDWAPRGFALLDPDGNRFGIFSFTGR